MPGARTWASCWSPFLQQYSSWWSTHSGAGPVYLLPAPVVGALGTDVPAAGPRHRARRAIITPKELEAEDAFRTACQNFSPHTVGVWHDQPVRYDHLVNPQ